MVFIVVTNFWSPHKQNKLEKKRKYRESTKQFEKCWKNKNKYISKKSIPKHLGNYRILVEEDQKIQD